MPRVGPALGADSSCLSRHHPAVTSLLAGSVFFFIVVVVIFIIVVVIFIFVFFVVVVVSRVSASLVARSLGLPARAAVLEAET